VKAAAADPGILEKMTATGQIVAPGDGKEFAASIEQQRKQVAAVAKLFGNKPVQ
jgi:tripartite-type tricarboxylate transporter receptor subunit TctC